MGADSWSLLLLRKDRDITQDHPVLMKYANQGGLICPDNYQPWSFDAAKFFLAAWKEKPISFLYDLEQKRRINCRGVTFPMAVLGSIHEVVYLVITVD